MDPQFCVDLIKYPETPDKIFIMALEKLPEKISKNIQELDDLILKRILKDLLKTDKENEKIKLLSLLFTNLLSKSDRPQITTFIQVFFILY